jgi:predicted dehydrogenase
MNCVKHVNVGLVGYGYWGPNLARNFNQQPGCRLAAVCDLDQARVQTAARLYPSNPPVHGTTRFQDILDDPEIDLVVIATPTSSHYDLARRALLAGKDVLVEKPITATVQEAHEVVKIAEANKRILAVDHTFLYTPAVQKIRDLVRGGVIGKPIYLDSVRINLGLFQHDANVVQDLATHDFSIASFVIDERPNSVQATGVCYGSDKLESIAYIHVGYPSNFFMHLHVNWVSPVKIRQMLIAGSEKMIVFDDLEPSEKVRIYDRGIVVSRPDPQAAYLLKVDYRSGDMVAPHLAAREALDAEASHVLDCVRERKQPLSNGRLGLEVVRLLDGCNQSLLRAGARIELKSAQ